MRFCSAPGKRFGDEYSGDLAMDPELLVAAGK